MSHVYFIGDLHFGHSNINVFRKQFPNEAVHRQFLMDTWTDLIRKRDIVYVMGDAAFTQDGLDSIGTLAWKGLWLTHIPIHQSELYGRTNVHGHCHRGGPSGVYESPNQYRGMGPGAKATYFNTCAEYLPTPFEPIEYHKMKEMINETISKGQCY
jgi:hypothetical protein